MTEFPKTMNDTGRAIQFALDHHKGQLYAGLPYAYHLARVAFVAGDFGFYDYTHQAACWLHDVVEDCGVEITEIEDKFGPLVAQHVWTCTGIGPNRAARNMNIAGKLASFPDGCIVKCSDRIANVEASALDPGTLMPQMEMATMYLRERESFLRIVAAHVPEAMLLRLNRGYDSLAALVTGS